MRCIPCQKDYRSLRVSLFPCCLALVWGKSKMEANNSVFSTSHLQTKSYFLLISM